MTRPSPYPVDARDHLDPAFVEWMMGFPPGWVATMGRKDALKALGNAVVPQQAAAAYSALGVMPGTAETVEALA